MNLSHRLLLAAGLLSLGAGVSAQPPGPLPTGGPGAPAASHRTPLPLTRADLKTRLEAAFDRMDATRDGRIDASDRTARRGERVALAFDRLDADKDGALSRDEFAAAREGRTGPGARPTAPARRPLMMMMHRHGAERGPARRPLMMRGGPDGGIGDTRTAEPLTRSAFVDRGLARFDRADSDADGTLSAAERRIARGPMPGRRGPAHLPPPRHMPPPPGQ